MNLHQIAIYYSKSSRIPFKEVILLFCSWIHMFYIADAHLGSGTNCMQILSCG